MSIFYLCFGCLRMALPFDKVSTNFQPLLIRCSACLKRSTNLTRHDKQTKWYVNNILDCVKFMDKKESKSYLSKRKIKIIENFSKM